MSLDILRDMTFLNLALRSGAANVLQCQSKDFEFKTVYIVFAKCCTLRAENEIKNSGLLTSGLHDARVKNQTLK